MTDTHLVTQFLWQSVLSFSFGKVRLPGLMSSSWLHSCHRSRKVWLAAAPRPRQLPHSLAAASAEGPVGTLPSCSQHPTPKKRKLLPSTQRRRRRSGDLDRAWHTEAWKAICTAKGISLQPRLGPRASQMLYGAAPLPQTSAQLSTRTSTPTVPASLGGGKATLACSVPHGLILLADSAQRWPVRSF